MLMCPGRPPQPIPSSAYGVSVHEFPSFRTVFVLNEKNRKIKREREGNHESRVLIRFSVADTERMLPEVHKNLLRSVHGSELSGTEAERLSGSEGGLSRSSSHSRGPRSSPTTCFVSHRRL